MTSCTVARCRHVHRRCALPSAGRPTAGSPPDAHGDLGRRFRDGDPDAVRELCDRFSRPLYAVALRLLFDAELARDAVQQTLLQAWRAASRFDVERDPAPWLFQICRRVCIDQLRAQRRTEALDDHVEDRRMAVSGSSMEQAWTDFEVRRAIDELPPDARDVVRLIHLDGWTVEQTAELLELPVGTVKSRSFRAHRRLGMALAHLRVPAAS
ncbi:MAG TPA: sigma-70 family RNA polymerase sigma factor [Ilumatobacteraceae bacterium]|nr:sigma-70 family RNA polymerase sigma factor [Ilumatobacteraceae bacterium]